MFTQIRMQANPINEILDFRKYIWFSSKGTTHAPADDPSEIPPSFIGFTQQWTTTVTLNAEKCSRFI